MAISDPHGLSMNTQQIGIHFTKCIDNDTDVNNLDNDVYYFDTRDNLVHYKNINGVSISIFHYLDLSLYAPLISPVFTGIPIGPTADISNNTTQLATTAFVKLIAAIINTDLGIEITRALAAEGILATNILNEISRSTGIENTISSNLTTEIGNRISGDTSNTTAINNEITRATNAENTKAPLTGTGTSGTWSISISGNSASSTKLFTSRNINGVPFDGTANITILDSTKETTANKQNSLSVDGTGIKFVTVDAVNTGLNLKQAIITLTTVGSGNATFIGSVLNIPPLLSYTAGNYISIATGVITNTAPYIAPTANNSISGRSIVSTINAANGF